MEVTLLMILPISHMLFLLKWVMLVVVLDLPMGSSSPPSLAMPLPFYLLLSLFLVDAVLIPLITL